jgi:polar amino acid transport system ATP-binding protein
LSTAGNGSSPFVDVRGVSKWFGALQVLDQVSLDVAEHGVVCLIGASGSGKSTLLRCLNLLERVEEGEIHVDGLCLTKDKVDVNALRTARASIGRLDATPLAGLGVHCRCDASATGTN